MSSTKRKSSKKRPAADAYDEAHDRAEATSNPAIATVLFSLSGALMTKRYRIGNDGGLEVVGYDNARHFEVRTCDFSTLERIEAVLKEIPASACLIRGALLPGEGGERVCRTLHPKEGRDCCPHFEEVPRAWVMLDIDGIEPEHEIDLESPKEVGTYLTQHCLPPEFSKAGWVCQLSSGHLMPGNEGKIKAHLFCILSRPVVNDELKAWLDKEKFPVDPAPFRPVQVHYVAAPVIEEGVKDPCVEGRLHRFDPDGLGPVSVPDGLPRGSAKKKPKKKRTRKAKPCQGFGPSSDYDYKQAERLVEFVWNGELIKDYEGPFRDGERDDLTYRLFAEAKSRMINPDVMLEAVEGSGIDNGLGVVEEKMRSAYQGGGEYGRKVDAYWLPNYVFQVIVNGEPQGYREGDPVEWKAANHDTLNRLARFPSDPAPEPDERSDSVSEPDARYHELVRYFEGVLAASGERKRQGKRFGDIAPFGERTGASWAVEKWLLKNATNALFGESEAFKTYVTIYLLLCVATGTPCFAYEEFEGCPVDGPRDAILFAGEGYDDVLDRIGAAIEGGGFDRKLVEKHLIIVGDVYALNWANGLARMADEIEALDAHPAIIAVDTYNLALDGNEDSSDEAKRALRGLRALATMFDAAGLVLHHPGWGDTKRPRGSSAFRANADVMILCERAPGDAKMASLTQYKNRSADKTKYRAALVGEPVDLGVDVDTGETISNLSFSPITPSAVPSARDDSGLTKIGMANLYAEGLAQVLLDADDPTLGPSAAAQALREWLVSQDHKAPTANTLRKHFLYAVRDAIKGEPEYAAAYLIHSREKLMFSHPDRINGIKRAPRVTAEGFSRVTESDAKR